MILEVHQKDPEIRKIKRAVELLASGQVLVCPTDTVYAFVCSCQQARAIEALSQLKGTRPQRTDMSMICADLAQASAFTRPMETSAFRIMKRAFPGPYTFILPASGEVPKVFKNKKRTVGIRIPDNAIVQALVRELGHPLVATSVHDDDEILEHTTDPLLIDSRFGDRVALVLDGGPGGITGSTVVDMTGPAPIILREGAGDPDLLDQ